MFHLIKSHEAYQALPRKVSNDVLRLLDKNWQSFIKVIKAWSADPSKFQGRPKLPRYKDKVKGRTILVYDIQAISKPDGGKKNLRTLLSRGVSKSLSDWIVVSHVMRNEMVSSGRRE